MTYCINFLPETHVFLQVAVVGVPGWAHWLFGYFHHPLVIAILAV